MKDANFLNSIIAKNADKRVNLLVTGGGPRSAFTAGMLATLANEHWENNFHYYIGQSSGSFSLMFLLSNDAVRGAAGYWNALPECFSDGSFVNPRRLLHPTKRVMDLQYLVDVFFETENPINWEKVLEHPANKKGKFLIKVMDANTGSYKFLSYFKSVAALKAAIVASSWLPLLAGIRPYKINQTVLSEMKILEKDLSEINTDLLETYDGQLVDSYFMETSSLMEDELNLVCVNEQPDEKALFENPFGRQLLKLEKKMSHILFWTHPNSIQTYKNSMLNGGRKRDFEKLIEISKQPESNILCSYPYDKVEINKVQYSEMKSAVHSGWKGMYEALGLKHKKMPGST